MSYICIINIDIVQLLSRVWLSVNPWTQVYPVLHYLPEFSQTHAHRVSDAIQPSHPLSSPSPPALNLSSIRVFSSEWTLHIRWPKYWRFSFSISPSMVIQGWFPLDWLVWSPCCSRDSQRVFPAPQFKSISSLALSLLYGPTLTSIHD